ncbi:MAG TPA: tetratricopeptide repeat-containing sensor histidine kinase [Cyclobacteriaceae bacterium]|nr:tetratricopeptide repeat-containing sensor histidine kinase [Cyclobacteriaceae bacterium]
MPFRKSFLLILLSLPLVAAAQHLVLIDSLKRQVPAASPELAFELLTQIGFEYRISYPDSAIYYCNKAYNFGLQRGIKKGMSKPLSFMGLAYNYKGEVTKAYEYHNLAIETAEAEGDKVQLAYGYNNLGRLFFDQGDLSRALNFFMQALDLMEETEDELGLSYVHRSLSSLYRSQNDLKKSLEASQLALKYRQILGDPRPLLSAYFEIGLVYKDIGQPEQALNYLMLADSIAEQINDAISMTEINLGIAELYLSTGNIEPAEEFATEAYDILKNTSNQRLMLRANLLLAQIYFKQRKYNSAELYVEGALREAEKVNNLAIQRDAWQLKSEIANSKKEEEKFIQYQNKHLILKEQLQNVGLTREIERMEFRHELDKSEQEKEILKANEERFNAQLAQRKVERIALSVILLIISVTAFLLWQNNKQRNRDNVKLMEQSKQISKQNEDLLHLNNEKDTLVNIVAHDLKSPIQRIQGLSDLIQMRGDMNEEQRKYLTLIKNELRASSELIGDLLDVNALESGRSKVDLKEVDVNQLIRQRIELFSAAAEAKKINLKAELQEILTISIDPYLVSRIIDNLLSNAIKFSFKESEVLLRAFKDDEYLIISVKDQGQGFTDEDKAYLYQKFKKLSARPTAGESSNGLGLAIVKILTDRLKGEIELFTEPSKGSEFVVKFKV